MKTQPENPATSKVQNTEADSIPETIIGIKQPDETGKNEGELPGYPHYPPSEDIMNTGNLLEKSERIVEDFPRNAPEDNTAQVKEPAADNIFESNNDDEDADEIELEINEADITREDLLALGSDELNTVEADDAQLQKRSAPVDMAGADLDVPGSELDDDSEIVGSEDEENNTYSIGGDRHDDLEENSTDNEEQL